MPDLPPYDALRGVGRGVLLGLVAEHGAGPWAATYEHRWERDRRTWEAVMAAVAAAARGSRPAAPAEAPPRWLAPLARRLLAGAARSSWQGGHFLEARLLERLGLLDLDHDDDYVLALVSANPGAAALRADPELLDGALWRVFEVEGGGEVSLANVDKYGRGASWQQAFLDLVADGSLPRERVLRACLAALRRDFGAYRAGWFARAYDALAPTAAEQAAHQDDLRALLRSPVAATVTMAVRRLRALGQAGLLDDAATVAALGPALLSPVKGAALDAVRLLGEAARRGTPVAEAAAGALDHPHADVQRAAAALLDRLGAGVPRERAAALEPSVAVSLGAVAAAAPDVPVTPLPPPVARPVRDDLLDRVAGVLEDAGDPFEVEAVLAGLASLADPAVLAPLRRRAATVLSRGPREGVVPGWLRGRLARLVLVAAGERPAPLPGDHVTAFLAGRLGEVEAVLAGGRPFTPAATPDDGWWVRPESLAGRAPGAPRHDLVAALLRLAPDGRVPAGEGPVAYALGGPPPRLPRLRPRLADPALWVAAARARDPLGHDAVLAAAGLRGAGRAAPLRTEVRLRERHYGSGRSGWEWDVRCAGAARQPPADQPTAQVGGPGFWGPEHEDWAPWLATVWPHDAEHFLLPLCDAVLHAAHGTMTRHDAVRVLAALAAHPGRLGPLAHATLAAGLAAGRADQRVRAVDAALAQPFSAAALAGAMATTRRVLTAARWGRGLADLAAAGRGAFVVETLTALLPRLPHDAAGLSALTAVLREESLRRNASPPPELRAWLAAFPGSSRAARDARALLAGC